MFQIKFESAGFSDFDHSNLKLLTPKELLQKLLIALAQVKKGSTYENVLTKICQLIYYLYHEK